MKTLGSYVFLKKKTVESKSSTGIVASGHEGEPIGELAAGPVDVSRGTYAYDPAHAKEITLAGETYIVTKTEYLLASL